jgi:glycerol kinase
LLFKLTGGAVHKTDVTNASRTMLMDLQTLQWDDTLLTVFGVPRTMLPVICSSSEV